MNPLDSTLRILRLNATDPDPALVQENTPETLALYTAYQRDRDPEKLPALLPDAKPTWFVIKRLPAAYLSAVIDGIFPVSAQRDHAVRAACHRVELPGEAALSATPKKTAKLGTPFLTTEVAHGVNLAGDDWIQELADRFGSETIQEIGQVALDQARLPRGRRGPFSSWGGTVHSR